MNATMNAITEAFSQSYRHILTSNRHSTQSAAGGRPSFFRLSDRFEATLAQFLGQLGSFLGNFGDDPRLDLNSGKNEERARAARGLTTWF